MKQIIFALTLVFAFQSVTFAGSTHSLKAAYDEYLYSTTVEWNQVDADEIAAINARFAAEVADLQEQGLLTEAALHDLFISEITAGRLPEGILKEVLSPTGALDLGALKTAFASLRTQGANWNGTGKTMFKIVAWGFLPALIIIAIITTSGRKELCTDTAGQGYGLHEPFECN